MDALHTLYVAEGMGTGIPLGLIVEAAVAAANVREVGTLGRAASVGALIGNGALVKVGALAG